MFQRILLALDGSETAERVRPTLERIAQVMGSEVLVLRVHDTRARRDYPELESFDDDDGGDIERYLEGVVRELKTAGIAARSLTASGSPADAIVAVAERAKASMIAMATHGRRGVGRWALGSVAEKVMRTAHLPVLLVRAVAREPEAEAVMGRVARGLSSLALAIDGSQASLEMVPPIVPLAKALAAEVSLIHFVPEHAPKAAMSLAQGYLEAAREGFASQGIEVELVARRGDPALGLVDFGLFESERTPPDLLVMTTRGRSALSRLLFGSVADKVIRSTAIPLLVIPPPAPSA